MKLFDSTQISWNEPWFFLIRIREAWGWRRRVLLAIGLSILMFGVVYFFGPNRGLPGMIGISLAAGFVLVALLDVANIQREVTVQEDRIVVNNAVGYTWFETFKFDMINAIHLTRAAEWGKPYGNMIIASPDVNFLVAIPRKVSLDTLANILHRLGLVVHLSGWEPSESDTRIGVRNELELDPATVQGEIQIQPVEEREGPLLTPGQIAVQVVIALGPLLLALIGAIAVGVMLFLHWAETPLWDRIFFISLSAAAVVVSFLYLIWIGQFLAAGYGIRTARGKLPNRVGAIVDSRDEDLVVVEIFDRESWTATVSHSADFGFLRIDRSRGLFLFEGNKFRWTLPISALRVCRIEESIVGNEGNPNAERRYYVVLTANTNGEPWEAGLVYTRTEFGKDTSEIRYNRALLLFTQLAEVLRARAMRTAER